MKGNRNFLGRFSLDFRFFFFLARAVREVLESLTLEVSPGNLDEALGDRVWGEEIKGFPQAA